MRQTDRVQSYLISLVNFLGQGVVIIGLYSKRLCEHSRGLGLGYNLQASMLLEK